MSPILGNLIVIAALVAVVGLCGRAVIRSIRAELSGHCAGCPGGCAQGCGSCPSKKGGEGFLSK